MTDNARGATMTRLRDPAPASGPCMVTNPFSGFDSECEKLGVCVCVHPEISAGASIRATTMPDGNSRGENVVIFNGRSFQVYLPVRP